MAKRRTAKRGMSKRELQSQLGARKYAQVVAHAKKLLEKRMDPDRIAKEIGEELKSKFPDLSTKVLNDVPRSVPWR
jgi:hypothetical protein